MTILEQTAQRLVIRYRRDGMAWVLALFTVLSTFMVFNVLAGGVMQWPNLNPFERIAWLVWTTVSVLCVGGGAWLWNTARQGVTCALDHTSETCVIRKAYRLGTTEDQHAIYAVSHLATERNDEINMLGIFVVLRSGERIPLAIVPPHDEPEARQIMQTARNFLRQNLH